MNINENNIDLNYSIKFLIKDNISNDIQSIQNQQNILNSNDFNTSFNILEKSLNHLYEKTRVLQNVIDYTKLYVRNEINNSISECKTLLNQIENTRNFVTNNNYMNYNVPFINNNNIIVDRNNNIIPNVDIFNNTLFLSSKNKQNIDILDVNVDTEYKNHILLQNKTALKDKKYYRSVYKFDKISNKKIKEQVTIFIDENKILTNLNFDLVNCNLDSVVFYFLDGSCTTKKDILDCFNINKQVKKIVLNLESFNYIKTSSNILKTDNFDIFEMIDEIKKEDLLLNNEKYYYYLFGIDNITIEHCEQNKECGYISNPIKLNIDNNYLKLKADYNCINGSIEFNILDGNTVIPILPENVKTIYDEKYFIGQNTRFNIEKVINIKKNNILTDIKNIKDIPNDNNSYTISYIPFIKDYSINNVNKDFKLQTILRQYSNTNLCSITNINLNLYTNKIENNESKNDTCIIKENNKEILDKEVSNKEIVKEQIDKYLIKINYIFNENIMFTENIETRNKIDILSDISTPDENYKIDKIENIKWDNNNGECNITIYKDPTKIEKQEQKKCERYIYLFSPDSRIAKVQLFSQDYYNYLKKGYDEIPKKYKQIVSISDIPEKNKYGNDQVMMCSPEGRLKNKGADCFPIQNVDYINSLLKKGYVFAALNESSETIKAPVIMPEWLSCTPTITYTDYWNNGQMKWYYDRGNGCGNIYDTKEEATAALNAFEVYKQEEKAKWIKEHPDYMK